MHKIFLPLTLPLLAVSSPSNAASDPARCLEVVENANVDKAEKPRMRTLDREAPAAKIAAVDRRVDNCPVLVVLDDQLTGEPRWTAPESPPAAKRLPALGE